MTAFTMLLNVYHLRRCSYPSSSLVIRLLLFTSVFLSACTTLSVPSDYTLKDKTTEGLAVVSFSFEGLQPHEAPTWRYRRLDAEGSGYLLTNWAGEPLNWVDPPGRLAYFALPIGRYEFYASGYTRASNSSSPMAWSIGKGNVPSNTNPSYAVFNQPSYTGYDSEPFVVKFDIKAGKASYIGNLHLIWDDTKQLGMVSVRDESKRDLNLLFVKLPRIEVADVIIRSCQISD